MVVYDLITDMMYTVTYIIHVKFLHLGNGHLTLVGGLIFSDRK
jgi:hypothetical protein